MAATTIRVPRDLRDRLAERARARGSTLADVIDEALDVEDEVKFWSEVRTTMVTPGDRRELAAETERMSGTLRDGLGRDDEWEGVL